MCIVILGPLDRKRENRYSYCSTYFTNLVCFQFHVGIILISYYVSQVTTLLHFQGYVKGFVRVQSYSIYILLVKEPKVERRHHKISLFLSILVRFYPVPITKTNFFMTHFNSILPSTSWFSKCFLR
jgi:hypothetical protein